MRKYRHEIDNVRSHVRSLWIVIGIEVLAILILGFALVKAQDDVVVHLPPDLRSGATLTPDQIHPANVYAFAFYIFQQLNRWPDDGAEDFGNAIYSLSAYLTPKYRAALQKELELKGRRGELIHRVRGMQERPGHTFDELRVQVLTSGIWIVWLDLELQESVKGMSIKRTFIRYPLRVVRYAVDPEKNPWQLALDGFAEEGPRRLEEDELNPTTEEENSDANNS